MSEQPDHEYVEHQSPSRRGVKFDPTINLGHVLTFIALLITGVGAWSALDKRVTVIEESRYTQKQVDASQDAQVATLISQIKEVLVRLDRQVERLTDKMDGVKK